MLDRLELFSYAFAPECDFKSILRLMKGNDSK